MNLELDIDPALFGVWPKAPVYDGVRFSEWDDVLDAQAWRVVLDTKAEAVSPLDELQDMLNGMTRELREQMQQFQLLRRMAEEKASGITEEIDRKAVQADAKASIEAMSVIVRTLEKIDSLQRTIAHDRRIKAEEEVDDDGYQALLAAIDSRIESRAGERARQMQEQHVAGANAAAQADAPVGDGAVFGHAAVGRADIGPDDDGAVATGPP